MLERLDIVRTERLLDGRYEWVAATANYAVDPRDASSARIRDLDLVKPDKDGKVRFTGDVVMFRPVDGGNGRALLSVPNRGISGVPFSIGALPGGFGAPPVLGDSYLLNEGWTIALPGWQWDVPAGMIRFAAPVVDVEPGWMRADFRIDVPVAERSVGDEVPGGAGMPAIVFATYPAAHPDDPDATMRVRATQLGPSEVVPRSAWEFTSPTTVRIDGGFQPFHWYEVIYRSSFAPVVGAGLLALRDFGAYLRTDNAAVFGFGISQTGRVLREFLYEGLNVDEQGNQIFDGLFIDIASARRGEFNRRYAQPGQLSPMMPEYGPPYDSASLLERQRSRGGVPKIILKNSSWEYWRGDGALVHQHPTTGDDLPEDPDVRVHLISGTDHVGSAPAIKGVMPLTNPPHNLDPTLVHRALLRQLQDWALDAVEPSPSSVPRKADGTAVSRESVLDRFPKSTIPDAAVLPYTPVMDPESTTWPIELGAPLVALVSDVDEAGNELAGIRLPEVETGVAAYTGWNPRRHVDGLPDVLFDLFGSKLPPLNGRTPTAAEIRAAAESLVERRFLLAEDLEQAIAQATPPPVVE